MALAPEPGRSGACARAQVGPRSEVGRRKKGEEKAKPSGRKAQALTVKRL
jgi:hypothetical protein